MNMFGRNGISRNVGNKANGPQVAGLNRNGMYMYNETILLSGTLTKYKYLRCGSRERERE